MENAATATTYLYERWRAIATGVLETAGQTFLLLIAVRYFNAGATAKALIAAGGSVGLVLTPLVVWTVTAYGRTPALVASQLAAVGAASFLVAALWPALPVFVVCSMAALAGASMSIPLLTQVYQDNYPETERGQRFSRTVMIRVAVAAVASQLAGGALSGHVERFQWLLLVYAGAFAFSSWCLSRCPSSPIIPHGESAGSHPFRVLRFVRDDRVFRWTLICWMLMGFANLMMLPMRVEYLANPRHDLALTATMIAMLTGVIPNVMRLVLSPVWGWLFDHMNFFVLRVVLNLGFALGIFTFFTSHDLSGLVFGAIIFGVSSAGGDVAWTLWVTKFAPPDRVADYMSVHTFFTGLRGIAAPLVAFHVVAGLSMGALGGIAAGLIVAASLILTREIKLGKATDPATTLVERASQ